MPFVQSQQPDASIGRRYSKAFKYVFAMLKPGDDLSFVDPNDGTYNATSLVDEGRFVALALPQQLSWREPYATVVTVMQDGGKVVESKGGVLRIATISGTTGFLPPNSQATAPQPPFGQLVANSVDIDGALGQLSGYLAFQKLRFLFRQYADQRRLGNLEVQMHFFDYKNDDFWRIEPESFDWQRSNRRPMSYDYNVQFKALELSDNTTTADKESAPVSGIATPFSGRVFTSPTGILTKIAGGAGTAANTGILATVSRLSDKVDSGLAFLSNCDAVVQRSFQFVLNKVNGVVGFFQAVNDAFLTQLNLGLSLLVDASAELDLLLQTSEEFAPANINAEINEWSLEARSLIDNMGVQLDQLVASQPQQDVKDTDVRFSQGRMKQGATTDLMQEPSGGAGAPDANPFIGTSGLSLVTDVDALANNNQFITYIVQTGEDIYSIARRTLGSIQRFVDLVLINKLEAPYIVASTAAKPPNTLAWGDSILVPAPPSGSASASIGDASDPQSAPSTAGIVTTSSLPSQIIDTNQAWMTNQWIGYTVTATTGGTTQSLIAIANDSESLTLNGNWTITITPGTTTYAVAMVTFNPRRPVTPDTRAYGFDLLAVFGNDGRCDAAFGANGDFAIAAGNDNLIQAVTLRARCPIGRHPFHPSYGLPAPVGRPFTDSVMALSVYFMRRSLLADPRINKVSNVQLNLVADTLSMSAEIQPISSRLARTIATQVGS